MIFLEYIISGRPATTTVMLLDSCNHPNGRGKCFPKSNVFFVFKRFYITSEIL